MDLSNTQLLNTLAEALVLCVRYIEERQVPDDIADDDVKTLEGVAYVLLRAPIDLRPRLIELVGPQVAEWCGLVE